MPGGTDEHQDSHQHRPAHLCCLPLQWSGFNRVHKHLKQRRNRRGRTPPGGWLSSSSSTSVHPRCPAFLCSFPSTTAGKVKIGVGNLFKGPGDFRHRCAGWWRASRECAPCRLKAAPPCSPTSAQPPIRAFFPRNAAEKTPTAFLAFKGNDCSCG